jgi:hypothetical protein
MGLTPSTTKEEAVQSIADEAMLTGMEGFLHRLTQATLKKHCTELALNTDGEKKEMVWREEREGRERERGREEGGGHADWDGGLLAPAHASHDQETLHRAG